MANLNVEILIDQLSCLHISEEGALSDRDELYLMVVGNDPGGKIINARLPRYKDNDDYYEFFNGSTSSGSNWSNQDQAPVGPPRIWAGSLKPNESAKFLVTLAEQDNKILAKIRNAALEFLKDDQVKQLAQKDPRAEVARQVAEKLAGLLPTSTKDDIIGAFYVEVKNDKGKLLTSWIAVKLEFDEKGEFASTTINASSEIFVIGDNSVNLDFDGTRGALYKGTAKVKTYPTLPDSIKQARRYMGRSTDQCSAKTTFVHDGSKFVGVLKGQQKEIHLPSSTYGWICGDTEEGPNQAPGGTDLVVVRRAVNGREIKWFYFNEEPY